MLHVSLLYRSMMMKQKKTILLCCVTVALLALAGMTVLLCMGCDSDTTPDVTSGDTTVGDQITEETPTEGESLPFTAEPETDGEHTPEESQTSSETASDPEAPSESATDKPEEPTAEPEEPATEEPTVDALPTFEAYYAMSPAEQEAFYLSFSKPTDFFAWYNAAKDKYLEEHPGVELGPGGIIPTP